MRRFITRHSQIPDGSSYDGGHLFPVGETLISELGEEQARLVGIRLKNMNFSGVILSSPFVRTLLTAEIIAKETGAKIIPFAPVHEIFRHESQITTYSGLPKEEIQKTFSHLVEDFELAYPWWPNKLESMDDVYSRVDAGVKLAEQLYGDVDILYVGHGASCDALARSYKIKKKRYPIMFNCSLSYVDDTSGKTKRVWCDTEHLPYSKTTSNFVTKPQLDIERMTSSYDGAIETPDWLAAANGKCVLHIGDSESQSYPYFKAVIDTLKPDVIIHTGDMADEVKVGRIPGTKEEYVYKISVMCEILENSGAKEIIIVPGNNDLKEEIERLIPGALVLPEDSTVTIDGVDCRLTHNAAHFTPGCKWSFYGHGFTHDAWDPANNCEGKECRFNAYRGATICSLVDERYTTIKLPSNEF